MKPIHIHRLASGLAAIALLGLVGCIPNPTESGGNPKASTTSPASVKPKDPATTPLPQPCPAVMACDLNGEHCISPCDMPVDTSLVDPLPPIVDTSKTVHAEVKEPAPVKPVQDLPKICDADGTNCIIPCGVP